jgi:hypothetical protein
MGKKFVEEEFQWGDSGRRGSQISSKISPGSVHVALKGGSPVEQRSDGHTVFSLLILSVLLIALTVVVVCSGCAKKIVTPADILDMDGRSNVKDLVHNLSATLTGTPTTATLMGVTAPVVGSGKYTSCSFPTASLGMTPGMPFTAVCVVNSTSAYDDGLNHLMLLNRDGPASTYGWEIYKSMYGLVSISTWSQGVSVWTGIWCTATNWAPKTPHIVIATVDENNNQRIFLDGVEGFVRSEITSSPREEALGTNLYVGVYDDGLFPIEGSILAAIYNGVLSDDEIASLSAMTHWTDIHHLPHKR